MPLKEIFKACVFLFSRLRWLAASAIYLFLLYWRFALKWNLKSWLSGHHLNLGMPCHLFSTFWWKRKRTVSFVDYILHFLKTLEPTSRGEEGIGKRDCTLPTVFFGSFGFGKWRRGMMDLGDPWAGAPTTRYLLTVFFLVSGMFLSIPAFIS